MGLDISHDAWHGAYGAFNRWRTKIAQVIGIPLGLMEGHCEWTVDDSDRDDMSKLIMIGGNGPAYCAIVSACINTLPLKWESFKPDPLYSLLHHSDCDGELAWELCGPIADRLEELLPLLEGDGGGHVGSYRAKTEQFIRGARAAAEAREPLEFS